MPVKPLRRPRGRLFGTVPTGSARARLDQRSTHKRWNAITLPASLDGGPAAKAACLRIFVERWCHLGRIQHNHDRAAFPRRGTSPHRWLLRCRGRTRPRASENSGVGSPVASAPRNETRAPSARGLNRPHFSRRIVTIERRFALDESTACFQLPNKWLDSITILRNCLLGSRKSC